MDSATFQRAVAAFSEANARDPKRVLIDGELRPFALVQAERRVEWLFRLLPDASWALKLAAHCQHLRRWEIPRTNFDDGRLGYLTWRKELSRFHADAATEMLRGLGIDENVIADVRRINLKQGLHTNPETQVMEDVLCLVFLQYDFAEFAKHHDTKKLENIVRKTWDKMSDSGKEAALGIDLPPELLALVQRALSR